MNLRGGGSNHRDQHGKGDRLVDSQADGQHFVSLGEHSDHHKVLSDELRCRTPISAGRRCCTGCERLSFRVDQLVTGEADNHG